MAGRAGCRDRRSRRPDLLAYRVPFALAVLMLALVSFSLGGCPRESDEPAPAAGEPCDDYLDCVADGDPACGQLLNCADGVCEGSPSLTLPCP